MEAPWPDTMAMDTLPKSLRDWFSKRFGKPTPVQRMAWPAIMEGHHVLIGSPTGTGKTLAVLLPLIGQLVTSCEGPLWTTSKLRLLYVAPLKALINDAARNLEAHLREMAGFMPGDHPALRLELRTGDSTPAQRRTLRDDPP
ncbi:MAG: DEAD/DEAH box helicase, partial [Gemmataceae bacterium]